MGMEVADPVLSESRNASNPPSNDDDRFADVEIRKSEKLPRPEPKVVEGGGGRIGGVLYPNEKLPKPEPPPGLVLRYDDVADTQVSGRTDGEKDGIFAIGRFIRQRSSAIARRLVQNETEDWGANGSGNGVVVTELKLAGVKVTVHEKKAAAINGLKGRVTFFSRSNCRDSGAVRENGLSYLEINLDVYPTRETELLQRTGGSTVPKIFFNAKLIGGLVELNRLRKSGAVELEDKLKELLGGKCPEGDSSVPAPPVYGVDDETEEERTDKMIGIVRILKQRLPIQDRLIRMRVVSNSFTASDLVELLQKHLGCRRLLVLHLPSFLIN
ncbi:hypothetical protein V2J09_024115 [Rumex salicifolius]